MSTPAMRSLIKRDNARDLCKTALKKTGEARIDAQAAALIAVASLNLTSAAEFRALLGMTQAEFSLCLSIARHPNLTVQNPSALISRVISLARAGAK